MLKEACAVSALVAAVLVPSTISQAQDVRAGAVSASATTTSLGNCASTRAPNCKWMQEKNKRCLYCKQKKQGGGWKRQYCEQKKQEQGPQRLECTQVKSPTATSPNRVCETCVDQRTNKEVSTRCFTP